MNPIEKFHKSYKKMRTGKKCWQWLLHKNNGYGSIWLNNSNVKPHRFSYELYRGKIPEGMCIDHLCRNRSCVNPDHLEVVTNKENVLRGEGVTAINARKTHCISGHPFSGHNLVLLKNGWRKCRECGNAQLRRFFKRQKEKRDRNVNKLGSS